MNGQKPFRLMALGTSILLAAVVPTFAAQPQGILKSAEVKALVVNAKTSADHQKLVCHYTAMAEKHDEEAKEHEALGAEYSKHPTGHEAKHPNERRDGRTLQVLRRTLPESRQRNALARRGPSRNGEDLKVAPHLTTSSLHAYSPCALAGFNQ